METNPLLEQPDETTEGNLDEKAPGEASARGRERRDPRADALEAKVAGEGRGGQGRGHPPEIDWDAYLNSYQFNEPTTASNKDNVATDDLPSLRGQPGREGGPCPTT